MSDIQLSPPRWADALLTTLLRPSDAESIPGDLLEEYREVRHPSLGRIRADAWYIKQVLSVLWRVVRPFVVAIAAARMLSFPLPGGWNPSLVPAPGVSLLDGLIFVWAGYYGSMRTGRFSTGIVTSAVTSLLGVTMFLIAAAVTSRTQALCADTPRQWGTMDVTRMLRHLNFSADMSLGVEQVEDLSTPIVRDLTYLVLFEWVTNWPKGKMKAPDFVTPPPKGDFAFEQGELIRRMNLFVDELERSPDRTGVNPGLG